MPNRGCASGAFNVVVPATVVGRVFAERRYNVLQNRGKCRPWSGGIGNLAQKKTPLSRRCRRTSDPLARIRKRGFCQPRRADLPPLSRKTITFSSRASSSRGLFSPEPFWFCNHTCCTYSFSPSTEVSGCCQCPFSELYNTSLAEGQGFFVFLVAPATSAGCQAQSISHRQILP